MTRQRSPRPPRDLTQHEHLGLLVQLAQDLLIQITFYERRYPEHLSPLTRPVMKATEACDHLRELWASSIPPGAADPGAP